MLGFVMPVTGGAASPVKRRLVEAQAYAAGGDGAAPAGVAAAKAPKGSASPKRRTSVKNDLAAAEARRLQYLQKTGAADAEVEASLEADESTPAADLTASPGGSKPLPFGGASPPGRSDWRLSTLGAGASKSMWMFAPDFERVNLCLPCAPYGTKEPLRTRPAACPRRATPRGPRRRSSVTSRARSRRTA